MPYQVEQLLQGKPEPLCASPQESVLGALQKMLENDYSQLPVVEEKGENKYIKGIIRYKDIVQSMLHLELSLALLLLVYAIALLVGENLRDRLYGLPTHPQERVDLVPHKIGKKWRRYSGLFILLKQKRQLPTREWQAIINCTLQSFAAILHPLVPTYV